MQKPKVNLSIEPVDIKTVMSEEFNKESQKQLLIYESAPLLLDALKEVVYHSAHPLSRSLSIENARRLIEHVTGEAK